MKSKFPLKSFYFVRHGETDWNQQHRVMGQQDIPLNFHGKAQAHQAAKLLKDCTFDCIITSPLIRARETAEIIQTYKSVPIIHEDQLQEYGFGELEGETKVFDKIIEAWSRQITPFGAESLVCFDKRVIDGVCDVLQKYSNPLIVSHGGVFERLLHNLGYATQYIRNGEPYFFRSPKNESGMWFIYSLFE